MPVLCDFIQIVGDSPVTIGDNLPVWERNFNTGGRQSSSTAFLLFNVRGLTYTDQHVAVKINDAAIGRIRRYGGLSGSDKNVVAGHWYTQMIAMGGGTLNNGDNEIQIEAVGFPESTSTNMFDDFQIKNMVCFFHQAT